MHQTPATQPVPRQAAPRQAARPPRRPVSRQVRLHRTIAGVAALVVLLALVRAWAGAGGAGSEPAAVQAPASPTPAATSPVPTTSPSVPTTGSTSGPTTGSTSGPTTGPTTGLANPGAPPTADDQADGSAEDRPSSSSRAKVVEEGTGSLRVVAVPGPESTATGRAVRYTVEVEGGLGVDVGEVAATVRSVLLDPRGWQRADGVRFVNVSPQQEAGGAEVDIRVTLASPATTDRLCAPLRTLSQVSCWNQSRQRSVLNLRRWMLGIPAYPSIAAYRVYQINHEVGHGLGHHHEYCPREGARAPVMQQQSFGMQGCLPWAYPTR